MVSLKKRLEDIFSAVAYAEAADHATAVEMASFARRAKKRSWVNALSDTFAAVAFAEANEPRMAEQLIGQHATRRQDKGIESFLENIGLGGVRYHYALARI